MMLTARLPCQSRCAAITDNVQLKGDADRVLATQRFVETYMYEVQGRLLLPSCPALCLT
jgi:phage-related tail fiber protein